MFKCLSLKQALVGIFPEYCNYRCQNERTLLPSGVQPCSDWWVSGPHAGVKCTQSVRLSGIDAVTEQSQSSHSADKLILQHGPGSLTSRAGVGRTLEDNPQYIMTLILRHKKQTTEKFSWRFYNHGTSHLPHVAAKLH